MYEDMNQNSYGGFDPDSTTYHYNSKFCKFII